MTELFTLIALGAAFGWVCSKVMEPPLPSPGPWYHIKEPDKIEEIRIKIKNAERELNNKNYFTGLELFKELREELNFYKDRFSRSEKIGIDSSIKLCLEQVAEGLIKNQAYKEALPLLEEAALLSPDDINILKKITRINLALEKKEDAAENLEKILKIDPLFLDGYRRLARIFLENKEYDRLINICRRAIETFPEEKRIKLEMIERIALSLPPSHREKLSILTSWIEELLKEKNYHRALEVIEETAKIFPEKLSLKALTGQIHYKLGKINKAREELESIKDYCKENLETGFYLGATYFIEGNIDRSLSYLNQFLNLEKETSDLPLEEKTKKLKALQIPGNNSMEIMRSYNSLLYPAIAMAGEIYRRRGLLDEAEELFLKVTEDGYKYLDEENIKFLTELGENFAAKKDEREYYWKNRADQLISTIKRKKSNKNTLQDFWLKFHPSEPEDIIGEGGMAVVYRGIEIETGREVAIKRMHRQFCLHPKARSFFHKEVSALEALSYPEPHPNIVEFIAHGICEDRFVFAMELVEGKSLRDALLMGEINTKEKLFSIICQICSGLSRAHNDEKKIVHRDLKPENILLAKDGIVKLTDFGICRVSSLSTSTRQHYQRTRSFVGTSHYSAPEQYPDPFDGTLPPIDHRADIYSLGCIIYEILTTQPPFVHTDPGIIGLMHQRRFIEGKEECKIIAPGRRNPILPERLEMTSDQISAMDGLVMKCLRKKPGARYQSVDEIKKEIINISVALRASDA